jgi:ribosomal protein S18 acetylase RimI-like enzyme
MRHIEEFRAGLDSVARERRYLTFLEASSLQETRRFVRRNIRDGYPQCVALVEEKVVGWCDALPIDRPTRAHTAVLGIGVLAEFRGRGIGTALLRETLQKARASDLTRIELSVREGKARVIGLYQRFGFVH